MDGTVSGGFAIKPDQMQVVNSTMILAFIPLFDKVLYPLLGKFGLLKKPLQRMNAGMFLAGTSFIISALIETQLEVSQVPIP